MRSPTQTPRRPLTIVSTAVSDSPPILPPSPPLSVSHGSAAAAAWWPWSVSPSPRPSPSPWSSWAPSARTTAPREPWIPTYLVVAGSFSIIKTAFNIAFRIKQRKDRSDTQDDQQPKGTPLWLDTLFNAVLFAWFIAGTVWVYRSVWPNFSQPFSSNNGTNTTPISQAAVVPNNPAYCSETVFKLAFAVVTLSWALFALALTCCSGVAVCMCLILGIRGTGAGSIERRSWDDEPSRNVTSGLHQTKDCPPPATYAATEDETRPPQSPT